MINGEQAILCDLLNRHQFSDLLNGTKKGGMSDEWAKALQQAVESGEITENTRTSIPARLNSISSNKQIFSLLLADLLSVGFSIREALGFIKAINPKLAPCLASIDSRMQKGASFAQSLKPEVKDDLFYQLLLAEKHGNLTKNIE